MLNPVKISVLMPVYNAESYIREAIDSVLTQTFSDFELIIIDDGSTDKSAHIVHSYNDQRIKLFQNEHNEGIVASLNKGITLANGEYVAIMHADDVSLPERLEMQSSFLDSHPDVSMVAAKVLLIDSSGVCIGSWHHDQITTTFDQIHEMLPKTNCIAHPTIMIRTNVVRAYRYNAKQHATEDYDLWLRLVADSHRVEKSDAILLKYRVHSQSITGKSSSDRFKEVRTKTKFLAGAALGGRAATRFHVKVFWYTCSGLMNIWIGIIRQFLLLIARNLFILLGELSGAVCSRFMKRHGIIFFFPFPFEHVGGSERVHENIVASCIRLSPWVVIANEWVRSSTSSATAYTNISGLLRNPFSKNICIGFLVGYINHIRPRVFGGNCELYYLLLPHLDSQVSCIDIIHSYDSFMYEISVPHIPRICCRIVLSSKLRDDLVSLYSHNVGFENYIDRIEMVTYGVDLPDTYPLRSNKGVLEVFYVGRGTVEKRVHLVGRIARILQQVGLPVRVTLVGDVYDSVHEAERPFCRFYGEIHDQDTLNSLYRKADLLVITSTTEGVSLVKMEAMAYGVVPLAVAVGGVPEHIIDGETGFLVEPEQSEEDIVRDFCRIIEKLVENRDLLQTMSTRAFSYAHMNFNRSRSQQQFLKLVEKYD